MQCSVIHCLTLWDWHALQEDEELEADMGVPTECTTPKHPLEQALLLLEKHDAATAAKYIEEHTGSSSGSNPAQQQEEPQQQQQAHQHQVTGNKSLFEMQLQHREGQDAKQLDTVVQDILCQPEQLTCSRSVFQPAVDTAGSKVAAALL